MFPTPIRIGVPSSVARVSPGSSIGVRLCGAGSPDSRRSPFCGADLPPVVSSLDLLAQMNLVASMLSQSRWAT